MKYLVSCILAFSFLGGPTAVGRDQFMPVSLIQLIATPEKFDSKLVHVQGFLELEREHSFLYVHEEDAKHWLVSNAIWVEPSEQMRRDAEKINIMYVEIEGLFQAGHERHEYFLSGGITQIRKCAAWSNPQHPISLRNQDRKNK